MDGPFETFLLVTDTRFKKKKKIDTFLFSRLDKENEEGKKKTATSKLSSEDKSWTSAPKSVNDTTVENFSTQSELVSFQF